jgi:asparagine synthase (glutamine-hydrolysing)
MTLQRALYLASRDRGIKTLLDGVGGDIVFSEGRRVARLLRAGHWLKAAREAEGQLRFYGQRSSLLIELYRNGRVAFVPQRARDLRARFFPRATDVRLMERMGSSLIGPEFAERIHAAERLRGLSMLEVRSLAREPNEELAANIDHPFLTVGRERYERVAAACGVEASDPFVDIRVVNFALSLPAAQRQDGGWPKVIVRRAMAGLLPDQIRWRRGKEHLGQAFTVSLMRDMRERVRFEIQRNRDRITSYVDMRAVGMAAEAFEHGDSSDQAERLYDAAHLAAWVGRFSCRPPVAETRAS